jgi:hypothetical protein
MCILYANVFDICLEMERSASDKEAPVSVAPVSAKVKAISFGKVNCYEFARTVGDNEVVGPVPLALDNEVLSIMVSSVDQYEASRAPLRKDRKEDFLLATPEERIAALENCGVVESQIFRLEQERLKRLKKDWSPQYLEEMARNHPTKHQGPQGVRQRLKRTGPTWSAIRRRISLKSAKQNMKCLMKKLRVTFKRTRSRGPKATYGARLPVNDGHGPSKAKKANATATASRGLEALALAQSADLPATAALNLTMKWEKVLMEGEGDTAFV